MKILFIVRSTLYTVYGGDTVQVIATAKYLRRLEVEVDILLANDSIDYSQYALLHIFNAIRPADALAHIRRSGKPYLLSTIFVDFTEYQDNQSRGAIALLNKVFSTDQMEYIKVLGRLIKNGESINSPEYLFYGHKRSVQKLAEGAAFLLPNSENEHERFTLKYKVERPYRVVYNGIDTEVFLTNEVDDERDANEVICVARIEGKKNQLALIKALNNTRFRLKIIGKPAPNHIAYYEECKRIAAKNVSFQSFVPQEQLVSYYKRAKVHVLASWNETCGLSSLEAAYLGCNIVITDKGDTEEYYGDDACYCDPGDPASIYNAVEKASQLAVSSGLQQKIENKYNWQEAARQTLIAYEQVLEEVHALERVPYWNDQITQNRTR